jgi:putative endonuclease
MEDKKWCVYMVECSDSTIYTGITNNLESRIKVHNSGKGSKYVKTRLPVRLLWNIESENRSEASKLEIKIKKLTRTQKLNIIENKKEVLDLF